MSDELSGVFDNIQLLDMISDVTRMVDPIQKKVIVYKNNAQTTHGLHCYNFLGKNTVCDNCISMRAYNDHASYVKIEYHDSRIMLITAIPYMLDGRTVVIELMKDMTGSMFLGASDSGAIESSGIYALIDNMNKLAFSDALTGLFNRRYIGEKLPVDILNCTLLSKKLSVIMADIDHFKRVNDTYGHLAGDAALKSFSETLSACVKRGSDWAARYGGEEFIVCMPGAELDVALSAAEQMRKAVEEKVIEYEGAAFHMTASFGVFCAVPGETSGMDDILRHADQLLYQAKQNGRNRTEAAAETGKS